jgi:3-oxoadipate enol-lactonase
MPWASHWKKGDVQGAIAAASQDKYLIAQGNDAAKKRMIEILSANPQDLTRAYFELSEKPALPRLREIAIPTLVLVGDADIPDVHAHAGAIEAGIPRAHRVVVKDVGHLMYVKKPAEFSRLVIGFIEQNKSGE